MSKNHHRAQSTIRFFSVLFASTLVMFVDTTKLHICAGKGGNGIVAWRREKYLPKGGPYGGNGAPGGSVYFHVSKDLQSLETYKNRRKLSAGDGAQGGPNQRQGKRGEDLIIDVPPGTLVKDAETGEILLDLTEIGEKVLFLKGGKGGLGNAFFKSPTHQAPNKCTPGKAGEERTIQLELKIIADVGLTGFPNAGKSTLISSLSPIPVKTGSYPFTTLSPAIRYLEFEDFRRIYIADIPGIIEGAHNNKGLGLEFLKHIERTKMLVFLLDAAPIEEGRSPSEDYAVLRSELEAYDQALNEKPYLIALNKTDEAGAQQHITEFFETFPHEKEAAVCISAYTGDGLTQLITRLQQICLP